ncbi:MAG: hypothetical protein KAV87_07955 [Desulfobacteraceae bacterium]|nr:hypothetical protein [Desulfobacteraceae bacterium]
MKCPKCGEEMKPVAMEATHNTGMIEVRLICKCEYWSYTFVYERDFVEGD